MAGLGFFFIRVSKIGRVMWRGGDGDGERGSKIEKGKRFRKAAG